LSPDAVFDESIMPHYFGNIKEAEKLYGKKLSQVYANNPGLIESRLLATAKDAEAAGLEPVTNAAKAQALQLHQHYLLKAQYDYMKSALERYGVNLSEGQKVPKALLNEF